MNIMDEQQEISDLNNELVEKAMVKLEAATKGPAVYTDPYTDPYKTCFGPRGRREDGETGRP